MSRIGKKPVPVPAKVKVAVDGRIVSAEGPKGKLSMELPPSISAKLDGAQISLVRPDDSARAKAMHGLARSLVANMVQGVESGFAKKLEIQGVGFKAAVKGSVINLALGFSHPINYPIPPGIKITITDQAGKTVPEGTFVTVEGADKRLVGAVAADIRGYYPPEPYKGKGVRYVGEQIIRKEGKTAQSK
ncbi:MAG TPA: 50S ribosomal protein L6 [Verrucomicrobiae bacterium]|nr:50S ribosomal protein L6 [Verrucomicrobiae bacterium]